MVSIAAIHAITVLAPFYPTLKDLAGKIGDGFTEEAGKRFLGWLTDFFHGTDAQVPFDRFLAEPEKVEHQDDLQAKLAALLDANVAKRDELESYLKSLQGARNQEINASGDNNRIAQAAGNHIKINIS